jgi:hypothetical protein
LKDARPDPAATSSTETQIEMSLATGRQTERAIVKDKGHHRWDGSQTRWFNIQIINSSNFTMVTGSKAPETPIDAKTYAEYDYPFSQLWEEPTDMAGDFSNVKSTAQIPELECSGDNTRKNSITDTGFFYDPKEKMPIFRSIQELERARE